MNSADSMHGMDHGHSNTSAMSDMNNSMITPTQHMMNMGSGSNMDHNMMGMGSGNDMDHMMKMGHNMMMPMYFNFSYPIRVLFFEWLITNPRQLIGSCIGVCVLAILYEGLKALRKKLLIKSKRMSSYQYNDNKEAVGFELAEKSKIGRVCCGWHLLQSLLHVVQTTIGMFLMLIYMTFNVWLAISVSLGAGVGYFLFAWTSHGDPSFGDHCD